MIRRRVLAGLALLGLPAPSLAQTGGKPRCYAGRTPEGVSVRTATSMGIMLGMAPISGTARDTYHEHTHIPAGPGPMTFVPARSELVCDIPDSRLVVRLVAPGAQGVRPEKVELYDEAELLLTLTGEALKADFFKFDSVSPMPGSYIDQRFAIEFGGPASSSPGHRRVAQMLLDGMKVGRVYYWPGNRVSHANTMQFVNIAERRALALRLVREQTARYQRGECVV